MCESHLIIENKLTEPDYYWFEKQKHNLTHNVNGKEHILLKGFEFGGTINYAAVHEIKDCHGVKSGYMFIVGEQ